MEEQRDKFQRELEELRHCMERNHTQPSGTSANIATSSAVIENQHAARPVTTSEVREHMIVIEASPPQEAVMDIDSSDDDVAMEPAHQAGRRTGTKDVNSKSPKLKRPKRSTSRPLRGRGGSNTHPDMNDE